MEGDRKGLETGGEWGRAGEGRKGVDRGAPSNKNSPLHHILCLSTAAHQTDDVVKASDEDCGGGAGVAVTYL